MDTGKIVWLASYPKSGNTWVRLLLGNLLGLQADDETDGEVGDSFAPVAGISSSRQVFEYFTSINTYDLTSDEIDRLRPAVYRRLASEHDDVAFIKAHDCFGRMPDGTPLFPADCSRGAIYIVRDPLDVAVSYAHHHGSDEFNRVVKGMNSSKRTIGGAHRDQLSQHMGDWSTHYRSWVEQREMPVCVVRYEDLKADTAGCLRRITEFVGLDESRFAISIDQAVEACRFDRLQQIEQAKGFSERPTKSSKFFRSGRSGEGKERLPLELQNDLIAHHSDVMRELGYLKGENE